MEQTYEWIRLAQAGDAAAKDNLLQENSGLIWSVVGRFRGRGEPEDLYQIGAIGLLKCIEKFDFSYDVASFLAYYSDKLSLAGLERITGVAQGQLSHYVTGRRQPSKKTVEKIQKALQNFGNELSHVNFA